ncbi:MAG TPA: acetylxylan esterase [Acidobacteriaceae bacterium]|nr:acetylxylan esterase [Acidobacteriaceae bacterium]
MRARFIASGFALLLTPLFAQTPAQLTGEQDHQRLLDLLHITALRPPVTPGAGGPNAANYDEARANPSPSLPNPLRLDSGKPVTSAKEWQTKRRPELVELFDREYLGRVPANAPAIRWEVVSTTPGSDGGVSTITKHLVGHADNSAYPAITVNIEVSLTLPATAPRPTPVVVEISWPPNPNARPPAAGELPTWQQQVLAKGWGYANFYASTLQADNAAGLQQGIIGLANHGQPRKLDDWGTLRAWAWGSSRLMDYFETDHDVDARHVAIEGHSRYGKTALVAMAYEPRFAVAYVSSSGAAGASLARRHFGEQLENIADTREYYWMDGNYIRYAELSPRLVTPADLPIDTHELIALCAPRPVFLGAGTTIGGDGWADSNGTFLATVAASPVYELLGRKGLVIDAFPAPDVALITGDLGFRQQHGGHTPLPNFPTFLTFASRYMPSSANQQ